MARPAKPVPPTGTTILSATIPVAEAAELRREARETGQPISAVAAQWLRGYREQRDRLGARRTAHFLERLGQVAREIADRYYDDWLDDPAVYEDVTDGWMEEIANYAPYDVAEEISRGNAMVAEIATVDDPQSRRLLCEGLFEKSRLRRLPREDRERFAAAAAAHHEALSTRRPSESEIGALAHARLISRARARELLIDQDLPKPAPPSADPSPTANFLNVWNTATLRLIALKNAEPVSPAVAAYIARTVELRVSLGHAGPVPSETVLQQRADILDALATLANGTVQPPGPLVEPPIGWETRSEESIFFEKAWLLAAKFALRRRARPTVEDIATVISKDPELLFLAGLPRPSTMVAVLERRGMLEAIDAELARALRPVEVSAGTKPLKGKRR